jgi:hypothetical protein
LHQVLSHHFLLTKVAFGYPPIPLEVQSRDQGATLIQEELLRERMLNSLAMPTRQKYAAINLECSEQMGLREQLCRLNHVVYYQ